MTSPPALLVGARYARGTAIATILVAFGWHLTNDLFALLINWSAYRPGGGYLAAAVWAAFSVVGVFAGIHALAGRHSPAFVATSTATVMLGTPALVAVCPPALTFSFGNWAWGTFGWFAQLILWHRRTVYLVAVLAANGLLMIITVGLVQPVAAIDVARWGTILYGTAVLQLILAMGSRQLEVEAMRSADATADQHRIVTERIVGGAVHAARQRRFQANARTTRDFLAAVADGTLDPQDATTRRQAGVEAARLRRLLAEHDDVPEPLLHELRASADVAERRGVIIELAVSGAVPPIPADVRRALTEAVLHLLALARTAARVTVAGDPSEVNVAVVADVYADPGLPPVDERVPVTIETHWEGERLCLMCRWRVLSPSP